MEISVTFRSIFRAAGEDNDHIVIGVHECHADEITAGDDYTRCVASVIAGLEPIADCPFYSAPFIMTDDGPNEPNVNPPTKISLLRGKVSRVFATTPLN